MLSKIKRNHLHHWQMNLFLSITFWEKNKIKNQNKTGFNHKPFGAKAAFPHSTQENTDPRSWL